MIIKLNENLYEVLAYADDLAIIREGKNSLNSIFQKINNWYKENVIKIE